MTCEECKGACCESIAVYLPGLSKDEFRYLSYHGEITDKERGGRKGVRLLAKCQWLGDNGKCAIYPTRPRVCRDYRQGSEGCLEAIKRFR